MIRFGIIGAGSIARKFATDIKVVPNASLVAVASRNLEKAIEFASEFNIENAFGSYEELAKSNLIDAVYIATPHNFHKEQSILFLNNQKHVLCEKPLAINQEEVFEMQEVARRNKKLLMEAMWAVFLPANLYAKRVIDSGELGNIQSMSFTFGFNLGDLNQNKELRLLNKNLAGGSLLDVGVYNIALSQYFKNSSIESISSSAVFYETGVDLSTKSTIIYSDGVTLITTSAINDDLKNDAIITMEKGTIRIPNYWCATSIIINNQTVDFPHVSNGFEYEIASFIESIENSHLENQVMTFERSLNVIKILDEIRLAIQLEY